MSDPTIPMILFCPVCGLQHIDRPSGDWDNPPHRSHLCHECGHVWRPADVATNGVAEIATHGKNDAPRARGRLPATIVEQRRCMALVESHLQSESPRVREMKADLLKRIRQRG